MTRLQFWILTAGSIVLVLFLILQVLFSRSAQYQQAEVVKAEQIVNAGRAYDTRLQQLAMRIYQVANQNQDQALKDLLVRQQIVVKPQATAAGAPAPTDGNSPAANR